MAPLVAKPPSAAAAAAPSPVSKPPTAAAPPPVASSEGLVQKVAAEVMPASLRAHLDAATNDDDMVNVLLVALDLFAPGVSIMMNFRSAGLSLGDAKALHTVAVKHRASLG